MQDIPIYRRTRIAPTPSGFLHIGNVASFVLTVGLARRYGASVLLRIDDLDRQRMRREFVDDIFETLQFLGIPWDEGPRDTDGFLRSWSQQARRGLYIEALDGLRARGAVFACRCSRSALARVAPDGAYPGTCLPLGLPLDGGEGHSWRVLPVSDTRIPVTDPRGVSETHPLPPGMRSFVVRKRDGEASYQLASLVDDLHFEVDLVVRGMDLLGSTLAQLQLAGLLPENGFGRTAFVHHPLLSDERGEKLSKSAGSTSIRQLRREGLDRASVFKRLSSVLGMEEPASDWGGLFRGLVSAGWAEGSFH
jgi:glutamyl/glutaminyl-tRNA synthetase